MELFADSRAIFAQLAAVPEVQAVRTLIENHDAALHAATIAALAVVRPAHIEERIGRQRQALNALVTRLPVRYAWAG